MKEDQNERQEPFGTQNPTEPPEEHTNPEPSEPGEETAEQTAAAEQAEEQQQESQESKFVLNLDEETMDRMEALEPPKPASKKKKKKKKRGMGFTIGFIGVIVAVSILLAGLILLVMNEVLGIYKPEKDIQVEIPRNSTTKEISEILEESGVIGHAWMFQIIVKLNGEGENFQYGLYDLNSHMPYEQIINELKKPAEKKDVVSVTIKEGVTIYQIADLLQEAKVCTKEEFLGAVNRLSFGLKFEEQVETNPLKFNRMEGYLFPDTYEFYLGESAENVLKKIYQNFDSKITDDLYAQMEKMDMTLEETITLASIIQGEAGDVAQMKKVSGVFHNRLNNPDEFPRLESDPTRKYVEEEIQPNDRTENKAMWEAYNTYEGKGLPPGAICNPGLDAIKAALYPESSDYYYFCSNLETREFFYAKTLQEHNSNLRKAGLR